MILVLGSFMVDLVAKCKEAPLSGETVIGTGFRNFLGGKGANQAITARRLGSEVIFAGMLGKDNYGEQFLKLFQEEGMDINHILTTNTHTGIGSITLEETGENRIVIIPGANLDYSVHNLQAIEDKIVESNLVIAQLEINLSVVRELGKLCKKHKKTFILNPAPAQKLDDELLSSVTFLTPNETELALLVESKSESLDDIKKNAQKLLKKGVKNVIVTLGGSGALLVSNNEITLFEGHKVNVIDTVGAGDSFNGALANALDNNLSLTDAISLGNVVGSLTVQKEGAIPSLPHKEDVIKACVNLDTSIYKHLL